MGSTFYSLKHDLRNDTRKSLNPHLQIPRKCDHVVLEVVLDGDEQMVPAGNHGHPGRQVPEHVVRGLTHALCVAVQSEVLLDHSLSRRQGDLDRSRGEMELLKLKSKVISKQQPLRLVKK